MSLPEWKYASPRCGDAGYWHVTLRAMGSDVLELNVEDNGAWTVCEAVRGTRIASGTSLVKGGGKFDAMNAAARVMQELTWNLLDLRKTT